ncbi:MAG: SDR family oxidoreductase [Oscillospiraceae bacterium]|nr:SDR family oxidoreductase [Oscillospiraceae bacterium]
MKTALITGATSGIGREIAVYLHSLGWRLILTGRNREMLCKMAKAFGSGTRTLSIDLSKPGAPQQVFAFCAGIQVDLLVNNAGFGVFGEFTETPLAQELELIDVNIRAVHILTKLFLRNMVKRDSGTILNVGSIAGFTSGPLLSGYYASKNYVVRLTTAIREELRRKGSNVKVAVLCPGPVDTNFNNRAGVTFSVKPANPRYVARYAVDCALDGKCIILPGLFVKIGWLGMQLCPETIAARFVYEFQKRKSKS